jgi:hypothetical protein
MRGFWLVIWLLLPVVALAYHMGPGQRRLKMDQVDDLVRSAAENAAAEKWLEATSLYDEALQMLPEDELEQGQLIRLELAKAKMFVKQLPDAHEELKELVDELADAAEPNQALLGEARSALANSQYYITWLMRLEGQPREVWEPEVEGARQTYRLLAENSQSTGDSEKCKVYQEDLEATIRLARMDLSELQGLPLPSQ